MMVWPVGRAHDRGLQSRPDRLEPLRQQIDLVADVRGHGRAIRAPWMGFDTPEFVAFNN